MSTYQPLPTRYDSMTYRQCGNSGISLPAISLGLWHNFGNSSSYSKQQELIFRSFDLGITHFDLANNYGPPPGSAEINFGKILKDNLAAYRNHLVISSKAGYHMWDGPYGQGGSRKYLLSSLDESLQRMQLDYVDIFYSHRFDPDVPLEETMGALDSAVRQGKALYVGISSYSAKKTAEAAAILKELGTPCIIHQPSYSMLNRWIEGETLQSIGDNGLGTIVFSPLAQGMLSDKYLNGIPEDSRAGKGAPSFRDEFINDETIKRIKALNEIAKRRGQSLSQMAIAWVLRDPRITSALIGASKVSQIEENVAALDNLEFTKEELDEIDQYAAESEINIWKKSSDAG
ncbi:L-glyceraldehyde 3-phosphate reductase [Puniceicoccaceae bacterium K14]|nr:L-glyceraldehyde 3-phosphate reductase [Puniceicoccaceae bacterium K14]